MLGLPEIDLQQEVAAIEAKGEIRECCETCEFFGLNWDWECGCKETPIVDFSAYGDPSEFHCNHWLRKGGN